MIEVYQSEIKGKLVDMFDIKHRQVLIAPKTKEKYYILDNDIKGESWIEIRINTYKGMSPGAIHYYGSIVWHKFRVTKDPKSNMHCSGYMDGLDITTELKIKIGRKLTRLDLADKNRWGCIYKVGAFVDAFELKEELASTIVRVFNKHFKNRKYTINSGIPDKKKSMRQNLLMEV